MKYLGFLKNKQLFQRVSLVEKMFMTRNLATILGAGLSLPRAFDILEEQTKNGKLKLITSQLKQDIKQGKSLADSFARYPDTFNNLYISMVKVGETAGNLEDVFKILDKQMKKEHELKSKIKNASIYPIIVLIVMIIIGIAMLYFVVPKLLIVFGKFNMRLPLSTRIIIGTSHAIQNYGLWLLIGAVILGFGLKSALKQKQNKKKLDWIILRLPVWGQLSNEFNCAQFARTLSSLIKSGVPIIEALKTLESTVNNLYYRDSIKTISEQVIKGKSLSECISHYPELYPALIRQMVAVGEETGQLENILERLAKFYEEEVDQATKNISVIIEPILMVIIGIAVGFFALSILKPIYSILQGVK